MTDPYLAPAPPYMTDSCRHALRQGLFPALSDAALAFLVEGLRRNDSRLIRGASTSPLPCPGSESLPACGACLIAYTGMGEGLVTVGELEEYFASLCWEIDTRLGERSAVRYVLHDWDGFAAEPVPLAEWLAEAEGALAARVAAA